MDMILHWIRSAALGAAGPCPSARDPSPLSPAFLITPTHPQALQGRIPSISGLSGLAVEWPSA